MSAGDATVAFHAGEGCPASIDRAELARALSALLPHFPRRVARVDALLVGDAAMDEAHRRYSKIEGTTDVLSFPTNDPDDPDAPVEVDLVLSVDVALREATARGHDTTREILLYVVHGTLHACGMRDDTEAGYAAIHAEEDRILRAGGFGPVFSAE